jgi:hypothetical protein
MFVPGSGAAVGKAGWKILARVFAHKLGTCMSRGKPVSDSYGKESATNIYDGRIHRYGFER